jgi:hypothetical protein
MKNLFKRNMEFILVIAWFVLVIIFAFFFTGCSDPKKTPEVPNPHRIELDNTSKYYDQNYNVYVLEGCEYIVVGVGQTRWGSHKGNCKNPIHYAK